MIIDDYSTILINLIERITAEEKDKMIAAGEKVAETIVKKGLVHVFGCGHSHMIAEETFYRAGGLVQVSPVFYEPLMLHESASLSSTLEKQEGLAHKVFSSVDFGENDILIVVSTSGVNSVPVEFADMARKNGIFVIGISSGSYLSQTPKNPLGKHLPEVCDISIDNMAPHGDACLRSQGIETAFTPVSTITSTFIINSILSSAVELCAKNGIIVPVYSSGNVPGGAERNKEFILEYKKRISSL